MVKPDTYFLTVPLLVAACLVRLLFREPRLHKAGEADEPGSLRDQVRDTYRVILQLSTRSGSSRSPCSPFCTGRTGPG